MESICNSFRKGFSLSIIHQTAFFRPTAQQRAEVDREPQFERCALNLRNIVVQDISARQLSLTLSPNQHNDVEY